MVIGAIDHGDEHIFAGQFLCRLKPAKTRAHDDDAWLLSRQIFHMFQL